MSNTSATGGPLTPDVAPAPLQDQALLNFLQSWVKGIVNIDGKLIRPRWQREPQSLPSETTDWIAFGITRKQSDVNAAELHFPSGSGYNEIRRHEVLTIAFSFYGPNAENLAHILREGIQVAQNRELLSLNDMGLVESSDVTPFPELVKDKWYYRTDMNITVRRQIKRKYAVQNLQGAQITVDNEHYVTQINV